MENYIYETHDALQNSLLPFIFHRNFSVVQHHCPPNWHEQIELLYCISGQGQIQCGMEHVRFQLGDLYIVNPGLPHCIYSDTTVVYHCLIIDTSFLRENGVDPTVHFRHQLRDDRFRELFAGVNEAFANYAQKKPYAVLEIRHQILGLLRYLCANYIADTPPESDTAANDYVKKALLYIRKNMAAPISLDQVASHVGVSKYHLCRSFKAVTGKTIIEMVNLIRCTEARRLIENGISVGSAAATCGYENLSYFSRTFQKIFNKLPSAFCTKVAIQTRKCYNGDT